MPMLICCWNFFDIFTHTSSISACDLYVNDAIEWAHELTTMNPILIPDEKPLNITEPIKPRVWVETEQIHSKVDRIIADRNEDTVDHNNEVSIQYIFGIESVNQWREFEPFFGEHKNIQSISL